MRSSVDDPIDADFEIRSLTPWKTVRRTPLGQLALGVVVVVLSCIFCAVCAGAGLGLLVLSAN